MFKFFKRKSQPVIQEKPFDPYAAEAVFGNVAPPIGYEEFWCIECPYMTIRFAVPPDVWKELRESEEWENFSNLLSKCQKEYTPV